VKQIQTGNVPLLARRPPTRRAWAHRKETIMPKAPFGARAWRRPVCGSIMSRITRIPAKFTIPGPFGMRSASWPMP